MTTADGGLLEAFRAGRCPDCGWNHFIPGPRGGMSENLECARCGSRFNVARAIGYDPAEIVFVERIGRDAVWPPVLFAPGERVRITVNGRTVRTYVGRVAQASPNGFSLVLVVPEFPHTLPVMFAGSDYADIITGEPVKVERLTQ